MGPTTDLGAVVSAEQSHPSPKFLPSGPMITEVPNHRHNRLLPVRSKRACNRRTACEYEIVAHTVRDEPVEAPHSLGDALLVGRNDLAQVFRVHPPRQRR
jgi:hypothetical protein